MYNLTKPQKLIYDMEKYAGGSIANVCGSIVIKGEKDISVLTNAVNELYRLNDALRIRITETDGVPLQVVTDYKEQKINVLHFEDKAELDSYAEKYAKVPMDFYGALCEINVVVLKNSYGILVKLHHIISDAWTLSLVGSQFNTLANGEIPEAYSYIDYIPAEQEYFNGKRYPKDKEYYIEQYKKCDDITYMSDKQVKSYVSKRKHFLIDEEKTAKIQNYANEHKTSVYMLLMTALGTYINRIKMNQEKFYIGTAILNRTNAQEKNTMGMFINTAPVLIELDNEKTFSENLRTISKTLFGIIKHQKFNYSEVLETLRHEFDFSGNLYDVMLSYQNAKFTGIDTEFESVWYHSGMQTESLQMHIDDRDSEGVLKIDYDYLIEIFTEKEIERMHEHIFNILFDAIINEDKKITELAILSEREENTLLYAFNDTKADYPKDKCVHQLFEEQVLNTPDKTAVIACDKTLTYDELNRLSNKIANSLIQNGVKANDIVAFALPRESSLIAIMFGILKSGAAYMPIDPDYPQDRKEYMISDSNAKFFITENNLNEFISDNEENPNVKMTSDNYCYCIYTSGSTGKPKGALLYHNGIVNLISDLSIYKDLSSCKTFGFMTTITFDVATQEIFTALLHGFTGVLFPERKHTDIKKIVDTIEKQNVDVIYATPSYFDTLTSAKDNANRILKALKIVVLAGENFYLNPIVEKLLADNDISFENHYGPAETHVISNTTIKNISNITIGKPVANTQIYILDKYNNPIPIGQIGELCIAGDGVGGGYLNRPELTAEKFIDNPFGEGKMYKTGDLAHWCEDGNIAYVGRNDFQVKIRGLRIELGEIENTIDSVEGVSQAVVVVRKDANGRQLICAFYTEHSTVDIADIKSAISSKLPKYMMPHIFTVLSEMPLTPSGKINRKALPEVDLTNISNDVEYIQPQTEMQRALASIMENVLNYSPIGLNDNFFDLGGDSLKAIEFVSKAHGEGIYFNLQDVFDNLTLEQMYESIENNDKQRVSFAEVDFTKINKILSKNKIENIGVSERKEIRNILLAGATGFLGMHILGDFLDNDTGIAYCLVRGIDTKSAKERFYELLHFYFGEKYDNSDRIVVICADLHKEKFDLTDTEYNMLLSNIDTVINAAATVKHYGSYEYFYEANVETVHQLIDFCKKSIAKLIHTSTLSVSGNSFEEYENDREIRFGEDNLYIGQPLDNVYARSKFEAEKVVLEAMGDGLQANIMRMGFLSNRYSDCVFQKNYESNAFLKRIMAIIKLGMIPKSFEQMPIEFTPIDLAANAVMTITRNFNNEFNVFHICNVKTIPMGQVINHLNKLGINVNVIEDVEFYDALKNIKQNDENSSIFEAFANDFKDGNKLDYSSKIVLDNKFSVEYLKQLGFEWTEIDFEYIKRYIEYFREIGYLEV